MPAQAGLTLPESATSCMPSQRPPSTGRANTLATSPTVIPTQGASSFGTSNETTPIAATFNPRRHRALQSPRWPPHRKSADLFSCSVSKCPVRSSIQPERFQPNPRRCAGVNRRRLAASVLALCQSCLPACGRLGEVLLLRGCSALNGSGADRIYQGFCAFLSGFCGGCFFWSFCCASCGLGCFR